MAIGAAGTQAPAVFASNCPRGDGWLRCCVFNLHWDPFLCLVLRGGDGVSVIIIFWGNISGFHYMELDIGGADCANFAGRRYLILHVSAGSCINRTDAKQS